MMRILWFIHKVNTFCAERTFTYKRYGQQHIGGKFFVGTITELYDSVYQKGNEKMEMCYAGALVMPNNYAVVDEDEMMYVDGGLTASLGEINIRLNSANLLCVAGDAVSVAMAFGGGVTIVGAIAGAIGGWYFTSTIYYIEQAHNQCAKLINKYGRSALGVMETTWDWIKITGIEVRLA